jgi:nitroreductase
MSNVDLPDYIEYTPDEMRQRATALYVDLRRRRTVRAFSDRPVPREVIEACLRTAGTAPSGANMQPWHFCVVGDPAVKRQIREASEEAEQAFYERRASREWLDALAPLGTNASKPFLEQAPYLIVIFAQRHGLDAEGNKTQHYYVTRSVGIATGMLVAAVHNAGLVSLTYTPSPMRFLNEILERPEREHPFLVLVVGYPAPEATVPRIDRKSLDQIATFF